MEAKIQRLLEAAKNAHGLMLDRLSTAELDYFGVNELGDAIRAVDEPPPVVRMYFDVAADTAINPALSCVGEIDTAGIPTGLVAEDVYERLGPPVNTLPPDFVDNDHDGCA